MWEFNINVLSGPKPVWSVSDCWTAIRAGLRNCQQLPLNTGLNKLSISQLTKHLAFKLCELIHSRAFRRKATQYF